MRFTSYLLLIVSFACGISGSFLIAYTFFWKKVDVVAPKQMVPIIVAKDDIPAGAEIAASFVTFEHVAIDDVPEGAVARFSDILYGRALYPISRGYPICRDMVSMRRKQTDSKSVGFVPIGFRVVPIEVTQPPGSASLEVNGRVNLMVDHSDNTSRFEAMRQETLGGRAAIKRVLDGVLVHSVTDVAASDVFQHHVVSLLLTSEQYDALVAASQEGKLRIAIAAPTLAQVTAPVQQVAATPPPAPAPIPSPAPVANPFTEIVLDSVSAPMLPLIVSETASAIASPVASQVKLQEPVANDETSTLREPATISDDTSAPQPTGKALFVRPNAASLQPRLSTQDTTRPEQLF